MKTNNYAVNYGFTKETFPLGTHMCHIYNNDTERKMVVKAFVESGLSSNEKVVQLADVANEGDLDNYLKDLGINADKERKTGQLVVKPAMKGYCPDGCFKAENMLDTWRRFYRMGQDEGYASVRGTGEPLWTQRNVPGSEHWVEYEAMLNELVLDYPFSGILCQYDARFYDGTTIFDVLSIHPLMVIQGQIVRNPYYIQPDKFLAGRSI
ncbi:MAG: MEDS domain-containing protein [Nitrospirae bacterium]|nr:MEDS domain-containing protein [Nitrospirota bacterium]